VAEATASKALARRPIDRARPPEPEESPQRVRLARHLMGVVTTFVLILLVWLHAALGMIPERGAQIFAVFGVGAIVVFSAWLGSGLNRRSKDPSLTMEQMLWGGTSLTVLAYYAVAGRALVIPFYLMTLLFGAFRLNLRRLLGIAGVFILGDGAAVLLSLTLGGAPHDGAALRREGLQWSELAIVLIWFAVMGGYVSQLRARLQHTNVELKGALKRIELIATLDELTGLKNRRAIQETLSQERLRGDRAGQPMCVAMIDADHFKAVNDQFGHASGDDVLKGLADAMRKALRETDSVGRYGGEEFLVVLPMTDLQQALVPLERIRCGAAAVRYPTLPADAGVTVSIGVAQRLADEDIEATVKRADAAVYEAKRRGRNCIVGAGGEPTP
jgi:diguanylate cyclase (GGDEF)-like protein